MLQVANYTEADGNTIWLHFLLGGGGDLQLQDGCQAVSINQQGLRLLHLCGSKNRYLKQHQGKVFSCIYGTKSRFFKAKLFLTEYNFFCQHLLWQLGRHIAFLTERTLSWGQWSGLEVSAVMRWLRPTLCSTSDTSPDPQQLTRELPTGDRGGDGHSHHRSQTLGRTFNEVDRVSWEADS